MNDSEIYSVLHYFLTRINGVSLHWYLEGSANLFIQGVSVVAKDVDITTTKEGYERIKAVIDIPIKEKHEPKKLKYAFECIIDGIDLEVAWYYDPQKPFCITPKILKWNGLELHVAPLTHAIKFYTYIGKLEKVELIKKHMQSHL